MVKTLNIDYHEYEQILKSESQKHGWGLILIAREQLKQWILKVRPKRLLDIGCHNRHLEETIKEWYSEIDTIGIDIIKYDVNPDVIASAEHLPFRNDYFDFITLIETLEHIPDYVTTLKECFRILKSGGILFIQSVSCLSRHAYEGDETHFHVLHPNCLERLCRLIGFKLIEKGLINLTFYIVFKRER